MRGRSAARRGCLRSSAFALAASTGLAAFRLLPLFLVFFTRNAAHVFRYASELGRSADVNGETVTFRCSRGEGSIPSDAPDDAEDYLLRNMIWCGAEYLARVGFGPGDAEKVAAICTARVGPFLPAA